MSRTELKRVSLYRVAGILLLYAPHLAWSAAIDGKQAYARHCALCHGASLEGSSGPTFGPPLRGKEFEGKWAQAPAEFLKYIQSRMPFQAPGSLDAATYAAVGSFILASHADAVAPSLEGPKQADVRDNYQDAIYQATRQRLDALGNGVSTVTDEKLNRSPDKDWLLWRGGGSTRGYTPLKQINRRNVARLANVWSVALNPGTNGIAPLVHDGVMYINSNGTVQALDATNGDVIWSYTREANSTRVPHSQPRSIALYGDAVYVPTVDNHVLALDAKTGSVRWDREIGKEADRLELTAGPLAVRGKIIQGVSGCQGDEFAGGCFIVALDSKTGEEVWRFYTIARPGEPGGDTWNGAPLERRFGGSVWTTGSYDADLNLVYFGVGQTYVDSTLLQPSDKPQKSRDALYTDSTLALDPDTGKLVWHYQHAAGDVWDQDWAFERTLITLRTPAGERKAVITAGKPGIFDAIDARTGEYLWSVDMGLQNLIIAIDPLTGRKTYDPALTPEMERRKFLCPSTLGNRNWPSSAYSPASGLVYLPMNQSCSDFRLIDTQAAIQRGDAKPSRDFKEMQRMPPSANGQYGRIVAVDVRTRKIVWTNRRRAAQSSGVLATAGGIVFEGGRDRYFRALDDRTGKTLWQIRLENSPNGFPIAYGVGQAQYIAIVVGAGTSVDGYFSRYTPELPTWGSSKRLAVFALPQKSQ